ncbi:MAG: 2-oxo acid dehydrogenase subunit E2 [Leucobacter sp.]
MNTDSASHEGRTAADGLYGTTEKVTRIRAIIAQRMTESLQGSAQLTATVEVDLSLLSAYRAQEKEAFREREGVGLSYLPFIVEAAVEALQAYPKLNATIDLDDGVIRYPDGEHIGIAVDTPRGLLVPVVKGAGSMGVTELARSIADLASRCRSGKIGLGDLAGGTFTVTNYGSVGTLLDTPIINQPQAAILGTGAIVRRPVAVVRPTGEAVEIHDMMYLSLSYDHRLVDGADAGRFLGHIRQRLESGQMTL